MKGYQRTRNEVLNALKVEENKGLSTYEAKRRLETFGMNELLKAKKDSLLKLFLKQFCDPMVIILIFASLLSCLMKEMIDAFIILFVIVLNACIGFVQEYKAEKALEALEKLSSLKANVLRDGKFIQIESNLLVPGDIVELSSGNYISADLRLLKSNNLKVDESILTGESETQEKDAEVILYEECSLHEQKNMVFMSTFVTSGSAIGVVVVSAMESEVGKVAFLLENAKSEKTPLQKRLAVLSKYLGLLAIVLCALMFIIYRLQGREPLHILLLSISLAVAAIPEGLPAVVSIVLALGVQKMSKKKAIVRKLHAVETLGSVSVICSDKTGTLTQNKMQVQEYVNAHLEKAFTKEMLHVFALCNSVHIQNEEFIGEPTEKALVLFASENGIDKNQLEQRKIRVKEIAFDSSRKCMTTVYKDLDGTMAYTKGALESVLDKCSYYHDGTTLLTGSQKEKIILEANKMGAKALRVLALAQKRVHHPDSTRLENNLVFLGLVALADPPRSEVKESIALCHKAGIVVNMITGDNELTAYAIAKQLNIVDSRKEVISGKMLENIDENTLQKTIQNYHVFARVTPTDKVRIVSALKANGEVVAMSGDGVNDAPALKSADIGIAMGKSGSDVCKQSSDMILSDDNFSTIVYAVEEGRVIYLNIQKAVLYLLSCNLGEIMALFLASVLLPGVASTLNAVQILWVNLVTDSFPALALGVDPKDQYIMDEKPRKVKESLFAHGGISFTLLNGMLIGTLTIVAFRYGLNTSEALAQTMAFMVLSISQLFHSLNLTNRVHSIFEVGLFKNRWLILTIIVGVLMQVSVVMIPAFQLILKTTPLNIVEWCIVFVLSLVPVIINELSKWVVKE